MRTTEEPDASPRERRAQGRLAVLLLAFWLPVCGWLFWHYDGRFATGAANQLIRIDPLTLPAAPSPGVVNVLYLADNSCPCGRGLNAQIDAVRRSFDGAVRQFVVAAGPTAIDTSIIRLGPIAAAHWQAALPQRPALVVWRADGELTYAGPLGGGSWCGAMNEGVAAIVRRALDGFSTPPVAQDVAGCFCTTPATMARVEAHSPATGYSS